MRRTMAEKRERMSNRLCVRTSNTMGIMDVLSDIVASMRVGMPHSARVDLPAPWGLKFPASPGAGFHVILRGAAWLLAPGMEPVPLALGDVLFLPHGGKHVIASNADASLVDVVQTVAGDWVVDGVPLAPGGPVTSMLCGTYLLDRAQTHPLLSGLPDVVHLPARVGERAAVHDTVTLLGRELEEGGPGVDALVPVLLEALLVYILRAWLTEQGGQAVAGWAAALSDPVVAVALTAIHQEPTESWTVQTLADRATISRAALARKFTAVVGRSPLGYLTWWRMVMACRQLTSSDAPLRTIAQASGYTSEYAFAKAFKREIGVPPGSYRAGARAPIGERSAIKSEPIGG
jgi:AraC-like DNA-binding protein